MFKKQTVTDIDVKGKHVLVRADYNVPLSDGVVVDDYRIKQSLPTLRYLRERGAKIIICSHLGRPNGAPDPKYSLFPVATRLAALLDTPVDFAEDAIGSDTVKQAKALKKGQVLLLENLRFHAEEEQNDATFAGQLAELADVMVQDAFGVVHRAHASTDAVTSHIPAVAGLLLETEVRTITTVMQRPKHPLVAIVGGAKIADKIDILDSFIAKADLVAIGGAMANTFLKASGVAVGESLVDDDELQVAKDILRRADEQSQTRDFSFVLPRDVVVAESLDTPKSTRIVDIASHTVADIESYPKRVPNTATHVASHEKILDIGPFSAAYIAGAIQLAHTVVWNGTMGVTEVQGTQGPVGPFAHGTEMLVEAMLGQLGGAKPFTVVGGGDTVAYVQSRDLTEAFDHVSTGGGASLELMAGRTLPGVAALLDKA